MTINYRQAMPNTVAHNLKCIAVVEPYPSKLQKRKHAMNIHLSLAPLISLIAGILILIMPRLLNFIVAIYLIVIGLIGLFGTGNLFK
ncbi:MAG: hypothetical protein A3I66_04345 [Burkholderiales bacterium RIFCSPLOWO2_02_FULL_57_36]|nr:MAG: hypothetical protein A3I66_04345 [Burkholderiales bacterium RIFCSPLOWO2_02_FULL_57_36]